MTARIESVAQLAELPIGTIIAATIGEYGVVAAVKTRSGWWKTTLNGHIAREVDGIHDIDLWVGADIMVRKADYLALAQHVDDCRKQVAAAQKRCAATAQRARLAAERISELEDELDELRRELDAAKQVAA